MSKRISKNMLRYIEQNKESLTFLKGLGQILNGTYGLRYHVWYREDMSRAERVLDKIYDVQCFFTDLFDDCIRFPYRNVVRGFRNVKDWYKIIWKDRQYDQSFLFRIISHKATLMAKFHESDQARCMKHLETAKELKIIAEIFKRVDENEYIYEDKYARSLKRWRMEEIDKRRTEHLNMAFNLIRRKSNTWWD